MKVKIRIKKTIDGHCVEFTIGVQTFSLSEQLDREGMTSYQYTKWYKRCLETAFKNLTP